MFLTAVVPIIRRTVVGSCGSVSGDHPIAPYVAQGATTWGEGQEERGGRGTKAYLSIARCTSILYTPHKTPSDHARAGLMKADQTVEAPTPPIEEEDGGWG